MNYIFVLSINLFSSMSCFNEIENFAYGSDITINLAVVSRHTTWPNVEYLST